MISEKTNFATYLKQKAKPCNISIEVLEDITIKQVHISKGEYWYWLAPAKKEATAKDQTKILNALFVFINTS